MANLDWGIVALFFTGLISVILYLNRFNRSVADFLAANRTAGRYMLTVSQSSASFGAISIVAVFEVHYKAGFPPLFWGMMMIPIGFIIAASGWVIYRYRETRVLTLAQFFELRYSRRLRIFMGLLAFVSGVINYGLFPAVAAHFFIYFCGLPVHFEWLGMSFDTFPVLMAVQLGVALTITLGGGQIAVMIADFLQGQFINVVMLLSLLWLLYLVKWEHIATAVSQAPPNASLINPFKTAHVADFNAWYYLISAVSAFYGTMAWQGSQAFNACAKNPHEARMGSILGQWRSALTAFLPPIAAIVALTIIRHPEFSDVAQAAQNQLAAIPGGEVQHQMTVPVILRLVFPAGLMGFFAAAMISASVSTDCSYLHSWGSIFIQDVALPIYGKPLSTKAHMRALKCSIVGVALFAFGFSFFFQQTENILLFFAATGAIFLGGAGSVIIGGLYWKKGTTTAAWIAMIVGSTIAVGSIFLRQFKPDFPFNGQQMYFFAIVSSISLYVLVSLIQNREYNLDRLLYRGKYHDLLPPQERTQKMPATGLASFMPGPNFTRGDRFIYWATLGMQIFFFSAAVITTLLYFIFHFGDDIWLKLWFGFVCICVLKAAIATMWFLIGGAFDFKSTLQLIKTSARNQEDDGSVTAGGEASPPEKVVVP